MELKLKHIAPYLPYGLNFIISEGKIFPLNANHIFNNHTGQYKGLERGAKIILRPLSDLTKEIEVGGERFVPALVLAELAINKENVKEVIKNSNSFGFDYKIVNKPFGKILKVTRLDEWILLISFNEPERCKHYIFEKLLEWHFDVFGLIESGLAIDINKIDE